MAVKTGDRLNESRERCFVNSMSDEEKLIETQLRELALVDKIIGLEAEVARLSIEAGIKDIRILHKSRAWQVGRFVLSPIVIFRKVFKR
jgi:hypothetical protein